MTGEEIGVALGELLRLDLDLRYRRPGYEAPFSPEFISEVSTLCSEKRIVYTAYDGDHLQLSPFMRRSVLLAGKVPANPESILGYRETVVANRTKWGVLMDDLSVVSGCDELWVFTDAVPDASGVPTLAEGVLVELLFFLNARPNGNIQFVSVAESLRGSLVCQPFTFSLQEVLAFLDEDQISSLATLAGLSPTVKHVDRPLAYHIFDPLDFKYAQWLRTDAYAKGYAPLVPGLAVELGDGQCGDLALGSILMAWLTLMRMAALAWTFIPMDRVRGASRVAKLMETLFQSQFPSKETSHRHWSEYSIPKAVDPVHWALTDRERLHCGQPIDH